MVDGGVVVVTFLLTRALPGDPAAYFAGPAATKQAVEEIRARLGLDRPLPVQFFAYVKDLAIGELGTSLTTGQPVVYHTQGGRQIAGLVDGQTYYVIVVDASTIKLADTAADALAGIAVSQSSLGSGSSQSITPLLPAQTVSFDAANVNVLVGHDPETSADIRLDNQILFSAAHGLVAGQEVVYDRGATANAGVEGLVEGLVAVLHCADAALAPDARRALVSAWMAALADDADLDVYSHYDDDKRYTRNLISSDNETYTLMLLARTAGKESPVHDHPCDGCWMRVVSGAVTETRYRLDAAANALAPTGEATAAAPAVLYIHDSMGLHKVGAARGARARTLHLYSPPFRTCRAWASAAGRADEPSRPVITYHSEYGQVVDYEARAGGGGPTQAPSITS